MCWLVFTIGALRRLSFFLSFFLLFLSLKKRKGEINWWGVYLCSEQLFPLPGFLHRNDPRGRLSAGSLAGMERLRCFSDLGFSLWPWPLCPQSGFCLCAWHGCVWLNLRALIDCTREMTEWSSMPFPAGRNLRSTQGCWRCLLAGGPWTTLDAVLAAGFVARLVSAYGRYRLL